MQLLQVVSPDIKRMAKEEGQAGRRKITQYTRYLTVLITLVQGLFISIGLESMTSPDGTPIRAQCGLAFPHGDHGHLHGRFHARHVAG